MEPEEWKMGILSRIKHAIYGSLFCWGILMMAAGLGTYYYDNDGGIALFILGVIFAIPGYWLYDEGYWSLRICAAWCFFIGIVDIFDGLVGLTGISALGPFTYGAPLPTYVVGLIFGIILIIMGYYFLDEASLNDPKGLTPIPLNINTNIYANRPHYSQGPQQYGPPQQQYAPQQQYVPTRHQEPQHAPTQQRGAGHGFRQSSLEELGQVIPEAIANVRKEIEHGSYTPNKADARGLRTKYREEFRIGEVLHGALDYRVIDVKKTGGMGIIYIVHVDKLKLHYVLKSFYEEGAWEPSKKMQLKREAQTWIELGRHYNIVAAKGIEEINGKQYIIMDYIRGQNLQHHIDLGLSPIGAVIFGVQIVNGMEYAHRKLGVVHKDLKPGNILIDIEGGAKVTDFGTASSYLFSGKGYTPEYASPEQFLEKDGHTVDTRSDIYSFGLIMYEMLTGRMPFECNDRKEYREKHLHEIPVEPIELVPEVEPELNAIVMKCLAKKPEDRYQTFTELKDLMVPYFEELTGEPLNLPEEEEETAAYYSIKGVTYMNLGDLDQAIQCFDKALELDPGWYEALNNKANVLLALGRIPESIDCLNKAIGMMPKGDPSYIISLIGLGANNIALGNVEKGMGYFDEVLRLDPDNLHGLVKKGFILAMLEEHHESLRLLDRAIQLDRNNSDAWYFRHMPLMEMERYDEALQSLDKAMKLNPQDADPWYGMGMVHMSMDNFEVAINCFEKSLKLDPRKEESLFYQGLILYEIYGDRNQAMLFVNRALQINPDNPGALDLLKAMKGGYSLMG